ncbi:MAG: hypothetical protein EXR79_10340 [Myxococcales bacterium]|nr:hypothetical protein [Myxococcales bacterium]
MTTPIPRDDHGTVEGTVLPIDEVRGWFATQRLARHAAGGPAFSLALVAVSLAAAVALLVGYGQPIERRLTRAVQVATQPTYVAVIPVRIAPQPPAHSKPTLQWNATQAWFAVEQ